MISNRQFLRCFASPTQLKWAFAKVSQMSTRQLTARLENTSNPQKTKATREF
jgi:hypothetical protein